MRVAALRELGVVVEHVRDPAAHPGREVASRRADHDDPAAGHVLAAVVADTLDHRGRARVAHREALAGDAAEERAPGGRAVEHGVADDHALLGAVRGAVGRPNGDHASRQALADVVVGVTDERQLDPGREPGAERLAGGTVELELPPRRSSRFFVT